MQQGLGGLPEGGSVQWCWPGWGGNLGSVHVQTLAPVRARCRGSAADDAANSARNLCDVTGNRDTHATLAAQSTLGNLFAGIQLTFSAAIRIDDAVIVEQEWGWIAEITLSCVVVRRWDLRRSRRAAAATLRHGRTRTIHRTARRGLSGLSPRCGPGSTGPPAARRPRSPRHPPTPVRPG
ncbi:mechanosensitive ion channel family protein [Aldersonia sp. NBC_00410]|uniref:mechanosensitive ion channel family protein n=1 Tax=Aldersonia sp. NBC_00410 TaxID=2975954 RepID=UPI002B1E1A28|nr:mechanosensitive ion channel family protein [Aldersonia sp. NBC_00410]